MGNEKVRLCRVPVRTRGHLEIVGGNVDVTSASLKQEEEFGSGPALLKGDPTKGCHVFSGIPFNKGVVPGHIACSSLLNFFAIVECGFVGGGPRRSCYIRRWGG